MNLITFDETEWPLVTVTWGRGEKSDQAVEQMLAQLGTCLARKQRFSVVLDSRLGTGVSAKQRRMFSDFQTEQGPLLKAYCAMALVLANSLQRGLVTAINWVAPPAAEQRTFSDPAPARAWCLQKLQLNAS